jgi:ligand-binding sensor domain-containing protein
LEVLELDSKRVLTILALGCAATLAACEEKTTVEPPDPAPQIETVATYKKTTNDNGQPNGLPSNDVYAFLAVSNGEFWIGTAAGIAKYPSLDATTRGPDDVVNEINGLPHPKVSAMVEHVGKGKVYVATWGGGVGVYDIAGDTWTQIRATTNGLRGNLVSDVAVSTEDLVYFATNDGVSIYNPTAGTFTSFSGTSLLDKLVSCVEVANISGTVERWYGPRLDEKVPASQISAHGITVSAGTLVRKYTTANSGLVEPNVNDILYDETLGVFWVAYSSEGLAEVNVPASTWRTHTMVDGLPSGTVFSVTRADGRVWAATQAGLAEQKNGRWQGYARSGGLQADRVRVVYSNDGTRLWLGFVEAGAARVDTDTN